MENKHSIRLLAYIFITFSLCLSFSVMVVEDLLFEHEAQNVALQNAVKKIKEREGVFRAYLNKSQDTLVAARHSSFFNDYLIDNAKREEVENLFSVIVNSDPFIQSVSYIDRSGNEQIKVARILRRDTRLHSPKQKDITKGFAVPSSELKNISQSPDFIASKNAVLEKVWFTQIDLSLRDNKTDSLYIPSIKTILPIQHKNHFVGVLIVRQALEHFIQDLTNAPLYDMILYDNQGDILYHYAQDKCSDKRCVVSFLGLNRNITHDFPMYAQQILSSPSLYTDSFVSGKFSLPVYGGVNIALQLNQAYVQQQEDRSQKQYLTVSVVIFILSLILTFFIIKLFSEKLLNIEQLNQLHESLNEATKIGNIGFWEASADTDIIKWSPGVYDIFEVDNKDEVITYEKFISFLPEEDIKKLQKQREYTLQHKCDYFVTHQITTSKNNIKFLEERAQHVFDDNGVYIKSIGSVLDVTQRCYDEECLRAQKDELQTIFDTVLEGISVLSLETKYEYFNKNYLELLECSEEELKESNFYDWVTDDGKKKATLAFQNLSKQGGHQHFERDYITRDGKMKRLTSSVSMMPDKRHFLMTTIDNTELYNAMQLIKKQVVTDDLTNLHNRKAYHEKIDELMAQYRRYGTIFSVMMIDIDFFKSVNDTYGHPVGDQVLIDLSHLIEEITRECDYVYRVGGEEFIVLLPHTDIHNAYLSAQKIREAVPEKITTIAGRKITVSIGVVEVNTTDTETSIFARVDEHLYTAKRSGRNRVCVEKKT